ncbi:hypothetical protein [Mycetocola saprophilus]|uniref:hypothetical protein n=1 Tax=Mycetocola saprophilus TaxID=76636 RepID=UPI003BF32BF2
MVTKAKADRVPTQTAALFDLDPITAARTHVFDTPHLPPLVVPKTFSHSGASAAGRGENLGEGVAQPASAVVTNLEEFRSRRDEGVPALHIGKFDRSEAYIHEFMAGAELLGFDPSPQQWKIADTVNAVNDDGSPYYATVGVCVPRRAGKTTAILALALGRCKTRPGTVVRFTAQTGSKARDRFLDMARKLERRYPNEWERGFKILKGAGHMVIEFTNGSFLQVVPPKGDSFRGDDGDLLILDEAQEHDAELSADLLAGCLATMDTRPTAQLIVAGTAGETRSGLLWDTLEDGRRQAAIEAGLIEPERDEDDDEDEDERDELTGIVEFAAPAGLNAVELLDADGRKNWVAARPIVAAAHPGIGTVTVMSKIRSRFQKLPLPKFMAEYLGVWPEDYTRGAIDPSKWRASALEDFPARPERCSIGIDVAPNGSSAAIVAAWRVDGIAYVEVIDHRPGTEWLVPRVAEVAVKYRAPVGHDTVGAVLVEAEALAKHRPAPRTRPIGYKDVAAACAAFMKALESDRLRHTDDGSLNTAALGVVKRPLGDAGWAWGRRASGDLDISALVAATWALRTFDTLPQGGTTGLVTSMSVTRKAS